MEPFSNGLKYNPINDELLICEHGNRGISGMWNTFNRIPTILDQLRLAYVFLYIHPMCLFCILDFKIYAQNSKNANKKAKIQKKGKDAKKAKKQK